MTIESALTFFIAIFIFGVTPGPGVFAILARALSQGAAPCTLLALGMVISDIAYLIMACFGLAAIANNWGELFTLIRWVGAAYLIHLGWQLWTTPITINDGAEKPRVGNSEAASFIKGFLISASNPKVILFYIAFLPTFMDLSTLTSDDIALASCLTLIALMAGLMLIALCASLARRWFCSESAMRGLNRSAGTIMAGAGVYLASRS